MAKNEAKIQFTADCKEFNSQISKANSTMQELRAELRLNETQMKANGTSVEALEDRYKILSKQFDASKSKTQALANKLEAAIRNFGEGSTEAEKWRTQLLNAQTAQEKIRQAMDACNKELTEQKSAMREAESATKKLAETINDQQEELTQLKKDYADAVLQHGKYSKEARTLAKEVDSLSDELNANQKRMAEVEAAADKLDNSLDNVDETAERVSEGFTVMKGAMAELVADGISGVVDGFAEIASGAFTMSNDIDKATNKFIAQTGSSKDSAKEFEDAMTSIYNGNYGESFEDISEAMATVKTAMGDIGTDELEKLTTDALILRDTFDMDVNESIRAVNSLMDQFGITADEAYSLIAQGAQNGLNQNGDLLDVVNEYALQFKDAGFSADDMFNVLANGAETGTWSVDKLGDAVKEFNIRASDGTVTKALKENAEAFGMTYNEANDLAWQVSQGNVGAYQELADKLRDVDNDTQRYQLGVAMFGTMWEDLGEETVLALLDTQGEISKTSDALDEINSVQYDDLGSALEGIGRNLETSLAEPIKNNVMPAINEFVEDVDWESVGQTIGEVFAVVVEGAIALVNGIKEVVQWMNEHKAIMAAVAAVVGILTTAITAYNVVNGIKAAMDAAQVTTVWALVAAHWAQVTAAMAAIAPYVLIVAAIAAVIAIIVLCVMYWDEIVAAVKKAWEKIKEVLAQWGEWIDTNVIQPVVKFFSDLWNSVKTAALNAWNGIKSTWSAVKAWFNSTVVQPVKNFFSGMWTSVKTAASNAWSGIKNTWSAVKNWYNTTVVQPVRNFFSNMWSGIKNAGSNAWSGIKNVWSGVSGFFSGIVGKVKTVFSKVKDHILSPYRNAINAVKNLFSKLKLAFPNIKLPHFGISPKGWKIGDLLKGSIPKLSIDWYKDGGIMMKPTVFGVNGNSIMAGGEAGPEAILPIDRLEGYIAGAIERHMNVVNLQSLADAIEELANRPIAVNINGRQFALATASDGDTVNGLRSNFKSRGLAIE